jgi:hypothetical protein
VFAGVWAKPAVFPLVVLLVFDHRISGCPPRFTDEVKKRQIFRKPIKIKAETHVSAFKVGSGAGI